MTEILLCWLSPLFQSAWQGELIWMTAIMGNTRFVILKREVTLFSHIVLKSYCNKQSEDRLTSWDMETGRFGQNIALIYIL